jgi:hypothetical protein
MHLDFPLTRRENLHVIEDVSCAAFPIFVTNLAYASNLEYLHFDVARLITTERTGQIEAMYEILCQNLQCCTKLRELSVSNVGVDRNGNCLWSVALLQALIPTITKRTDDLKSFKICLSGTPSDPVYAQQLLHKGVDVTFDFFKSLLLLTSLETLDIEISLSHLEALLRAFYPTDQMQKPSCITTLRITQHP